MFFLMAVLFCTACGSKKTQYLSIAVTSYNDNISPENGMTINVLKYDFKNDPVIVGSVPYTSQYPLAVYDESDNCIYYSAKSSGTKGDQLWQYNIETKEEKQLTDSLFAINSLRDRKSVV